MSIKEIVKENVVFVDQSMLNGIRLAMPVWNAWYTEGHWWNADIDTVLVCNLNHQVYSAENKVRLKCAT